MRRRWRMVACQLYKRSSRRTFQIFTGMIYFSFFGKISQCFCSGMERYLVGREIGRGSYGVVYKVTSRVDGQTYVLKKLQTASVPAKEREAQLQEVCLLLLCM